MQIYKTIRNFVRNFDELADENAINLGDGPAIRDAAIALVLTDLTASLRFAIPSVSTAPCGRFSTIRVAKE